MDFCYFNYFFFEFVGDFHINRNLSGNYGTIEIKSEDLIEGPTVNLNANSQFIEEYSRQFQRNMEARLIVDFWTDIARTLTTGDLINELYRRHPELIGPIKDELECADLLDYTPPQTGSDYSRVFDPYIHPFSGVFPTNQTT